MFKNRTYTKFQTLYLVMSNEALHGLILGYSDILLYRSSQALSGWIGDVFRSLQRYLIRMESGLCCSTQGHSLLSPRHSCFVWAVCLVWRCSFSLGFRWQFCPDRMCCSDGWSSGASSRFYTRSLAQSKWTLSIIEVNLLLRAFSAADCSLLQMYASIHSVSEL